MLHIQYLKDYTDQNTDWSVKAMTTATGTYYSYPISTRLSEDAGSLNILTSAGSLEVSYEVSDDKRAWYTPYMDGDDVSVLDAAVTGDKWIGFDLVPAEWIRMKFVLTGANSTVTATYRHREEVA